MKKKYKYIVLNVKFGSADELCFPGDGAFDDAPSGGILLNSSIVTLFKDYSSASRAVKRTMEYASKNGIDWGYFEIKRVVEAE